MPLPMFLHAGNIMTATEEPGMSRYPSSCVARDRAEASCKPFRLLMLADLSTFVMFNALKLIPRSRCAIRRLPSSAPVVRPRICGLAHAAGEEVR